MTKMFYKELERLCRLAPSDMRSLSKTGKTISELCDDMTIKLSASQMQSLDRLIDLKVMLQTGRLAVESYLEIIRDIQPTDGWIANLSVTKR